jgi:hypothetical protein
MNLKKILQFSYSPRLLGAFTSEEEFDKGQKKCSRTFYYNGTLLKLFYGRKYVPMELIKHLPEPNMDSVERKTKASDTVESDSEDKIEKIGLVTYPYEKQLLSVFGIFKGDEKTFTIKGNVLFNNSLYICPVQMSYRSSKRMTHFKIPSFNKVMTSVDSFFMQVQLSQMKVVLEKPDPSKINGYHIYNTPSRQKFQGLFLNDHLILHKDHIEESNQMARGLEFKMRSPTLIPFDCYNCLGKPMDSLIKGSSSVKDILQVIKSKLCKVCRLEMFREGELSNKYSSMEEQKDYAKKKIFFPNFVNEGEMNTNPKFKADAHTMEKMDFPFEKPFEVNPDGYGQSNYQQENHKQGPTESPNFFKGEIKQGKKQGFIYENFQGDECFAGYYRDGFRQGFGQLYKYGKYYYEGLFRKGRKHGKGHITFQSGESFTCSFNNNFLSTQSRTNTTKSQGPKSRPMSANKPSISPSRSNVTDRSPARRRRQPRKKKSTLEIQMPGSKPERNVEFSRLQANSRMMKERKQRKSKPLNLFKEDLEREREGVNLNEWIDSKQKSIHEKNSKARVSRWTPEQRELFDGKSDLEYSDIDKSGLTRMDSSVTRSGLFKSPNFKRKPVFLFENMDSLNFKNSNKN